MKNVQRVQLFDVRSLSISTSLASSLLHTNLTLYSEVSSYQPCPVPGDGAGTPVDGGQAGVLPLEELLALLHLHLYTYDVRICSRIAVNITTMM